jgi:hypothetical protein
MVLTINGVAISLIAAFLITRVIANHLYRVSATDAATFAAITLLLAGVAAPA